MKRILVIITLILLSFALTQIQINRINKETFQSYETVYVFSKALEKGTKMEKKYIKEGKVNTQFMSDDYFLSYDEVIGQTLQYDVKENTVITSAVLNKTTDQANSISSGDAVTSLKMAPETAVCWQMLPGENVSLYWIGEGDGQNLQFIGDVNVKSVLNEQLETEEADQSTRYILVESEKSIVETIIAHRDKGRFEIIVKDASTYKSKF